MSSVSVPASPRPPRPQLSPRARSAPASTPVSRPGSGASTPRHAGRQRDSFRGVQPGKAVHLSRPLATLYADLENCQEECEPLYLYLTGRDPGDMDALLDWCIEFEEMELFRAASAEFPRNTALVNIDEEPDLARRLREMGALHAVCVNATPEIGKLSKCLLHPAVTQLNVMGDLNEPATCEALCELLAASASLTCVGFLSAGPLPDKLFEAIRKSRSPVDVVLIDAKGIEGMTTVAGSSGYPGLAGLLGKGCVTNLKLLRDESALTLPLGTCLLSVPRLPSMWIEAEGSSGLFLAALMLKEGHQARLQLAVRVPDAVRATRMIVTASRAGKGHIDSICIDDADKNHPDPYRGECNLLLDKEMKRRLRREAFEAKFGPFGMQQAIKAFAASLPLEKNPGRETSAAEDAAGLAQALLRTEVFSGSQAGSALARLTKAAALAVDTGARHDLAVLAKELIDLGYDEEEVLGAIHEIFHKDLEGPDRMGDRGFPGWFTRSLFDGPSAASAPPAALSLVVTAVRLDEACRALAGAARARTIDFRFRELTRDMGPALHQALEPLMSNEPQLNFHLPQETEEEALKALLDHLAQLRPMRLNMDGLALAAMMIPEDFGSASLEPLQEFILAHEGVVPSLVGLMNAMNIRLGESRLRELTDWASRECPKAVGPLGELS